MMAGTRRATIPSAPVAAVTAPDAPPPARRVRALRDRLRAIYGVPAMAPHGDPLAELILTVLSQSTNDRNRDVAFLRLRDRFPGWDAVRDAPVEEIEEAIRPAGSRRSSRSGSRRSSRRSARRSTSRGCGTRRSPRAA